MDPNSERRLTLQGVISNVRLLSTDISIGDTEPESELDERQEADRAGELWSSMGEEVLGSVSW